MTAEESLWDVEQRREVESLATHHLDRAEIQSPDVVASWQDAPGFIP